MEEAHRGNMATSRRDEMWSDSMDTDRLWHERQREAQDHVGRGMEAVRVNGGKGGIKLTPR